MAWTPASVRPAASTRPEPPGPSRASAASSSPWTVRFPGCTWNPAKSVPSYSTRARKRRGAPSRALIAEPVLDELDLDDLGGITEPPANPHNPGVARRAICIFRRDLVEELVDHERLVGELGNHLAPGGEIAALGQGDHPLNTRADLLGLGLGGLDLLVAQDRHGQVLEQRQAGALLARQLASID